MAQTTSHKQPAPLSRGQRSYRTRLVNQAEATVEHQTKVCPHCTRRKPIKKFGFRVPRNTEGMLTKPRLQSWCDDCRSGKNKTDAN